MKPYITDSLENGRHVLRLQLEGIPRTRLNGILTGKHVVAYSLPEGHSLSAAWQYRMHFDDGTAWEFSSACTEIDGWQEIGSLNVRNVSNEPVSHLFQRTDIIAFPIRRLEYLVHQDAKVFAESGLIFASDDGKEIIVAAGVSPGSVSVLAPFSSQPFEPELSPQDYARLPV